MQSDDILVTVAGIAVASQDFGGLFRSRFENEAPGTPYEIIVNRGGQEITLQAELAITDVTTTELREAAGAGEKALRIREGLLTGS